MNSFWNKNIELFSSRFSRLASQLKLTEISEPDFTFWEVIPSKTGDFTAKENGILLHSAYNPKKEAENTVKSAKNQKSEIYSAAFFGIGLGYGPLLWAENFPDDTIIIIEPVPDYFFAALKYTDLSALLNHPRLILALQAGIDDATGLIEQTENFSHTALIENKAHTAHAPEYFSALHSLIERNKKKVQINNATLEKFSRLWLKNSCHNIKSFATLEGVNIYRDKCPQGLPAVLISAGPTLSDILPHLKEIKKRSVLIAVDTALRACLNAGVEPDFIILVDPQYYAYRHIAGLKSPSSVLITESAAYPSAFRFDCRKKVLCSSLFPLGQYFESKLGKKGELGAGGSVSTTAWDFARLIGAKSIYCAGLDLGYPQLESHIRGSLFEEKAHLSETRKLPSEKLLASSLFTANTVKDRDYAGNTIFTDDKMKMFAWWFESKSQEYIDIQSFSLSEKSLFIPGFKPADITELANLPEAEGIRLKQKFFTDSETCATGSAAGNSPEESFNKVYSELLEGFEVLYNTAKKGLKTADSGLTERSPEKISSLIKNLEKIDEQILKSRFKEAASLVFPPENKLNEILASVPLPQEPAKAMFTRSKIIYRELMTAIRSYQNFL